MSLSSASPPVTLDQLIALSDEMRALVRCGVPLERGLAALSQDMPADQGAIAADLARSSEAGQSVEQWLQNNSDRLPAVYRAMVVAGLRSGRLSAAMEGFVATARRAADLRRTVGMALLYPLLVLVLVSLLASAILGRLATHYRNLERLEALHKDAPIHRLIPVLEFVGHWAWVVAPVALLLALVWWLQTRWAPTLQPSRFVRWMAWLPGARRMLRSSFTATFTDLLALLLQQRVPLDESLRLAAEASGDRATQQEAAQLARDIQQGSRIAADPHDPLRRGAISPLVRWLLASQSDSTQLVTALQAHSQAEGRRAEYLSQWLRIQTPVILTLCIGGTATVVYALSVLVPWYGVLHDFARP